MIERKESLLLCDCGRTMEEIRKDDQLIAISCKCGLRMTTLEEFWRMRKHQMEVEDSERGKRMKKRLEFGEEFNPYKIKTHQAEWTSPGEKKRRRRTNVMVNLLIAVTMTCILVLTWHLVN